ncbi:MAG: response regulator transcription factor [Halopseudomonas sp.]
MRDPITVVVADSAPIYRKAIQIAVNQLRPEVRFAEASNWQQLEHYLRSAKTIELLVVDLALSGLKSLSQLYALKTFCHCPIVVTTDSASLTLVQGTQAAGASALVCKSLSAQQFTIALQEVLSGKQCFPHVDALINASHATHQQHAFEYLSRGERQVVGRLRDGWKNRQIAEQLKLSESTVKTHLRNAYRKLKVDNRTQLVSIALSWPRLA